jgi:hypothetical protein
VAVAVGVGVAVFVAVGVLVGVGDTVRVAVGVGVKVGGFGVAVAVGVIGSSSVKRIALKETVLERNASPVKSVSTTRHDCPALQLRSPKWTHTLASGA